MSSKTPEVHPEPVLVGVHLGHVSGLGDLPVFVVEGHVDVPEGDAFSHDGVDVPVVGGLDVIRANLLLLDPLPVALVGDFRDDVGIAGLLHGGELDVAAAGGGEEVEVVAIAPAGAVEVGVDDALVRGNRHQ